MCGLDWLPGLASGLGSRRPAPRFPLGGLPDALRCSGLHAYRCRIVPVLLPEGPQPVQVGEGWVEILIYTVITIRGHVQEELLKIWEGR